MCLAMNPDKLKPGERCASTSNRNFEGRQGGGGRTHLVSPAMAAAAAIQGTLTDIRTFADGAVLDKTIEPLGDTLPKTEYAPVGREEPTRAEGGGDGGAGGMPKFSTLKGIAAPMNIQNVDTDMIIPKQFLKTIKRSGLGVSLFYEMRFDQESGKELPDFVLNKEPYRNAKIFGRMSKDIVVLDITTPVYVP